MVTNLEKHLKVFISYCHESKEHDRSVLALADRLCRDGLDCNLDQYEESPRQGWPRWMEQQIRNSDYVLVICTETYDKRAGGDETPGKGKGGRFESLLTYQEIYDNDSINEKFIPIIFDPNNTKFVPRPLKPFQYYDLNSNTGYKDLYRKLTEQPLIKKPKIGKPRKLPVGINLKNKFRRDLKIQQDQQNYIKKIHHSRRTPPLTSDQGSKSKPLLTGPKSPQSIKHREKIRIYELAEELNIEIKQTIKGATNEGIRVSTGFNTITSEQAERIRKKYASYKTSESISLKQNEQIDQVQKQKSTPIRLDLTGLLKEASYAPTICASPDGYWLATLHANQTVHLWAINELSQHIAITPRTTDGYFISSAMRKTSKGWELLLGLSQGIECWHIDSVGTYNLIEFNSYPNLIQVQFSTNGNLLLIVTLEGFLQIRRTDNGELVRRFNCNENLTTGSFCDSNRYVIAGSKLGKTFVWEIASKKLINSRNDHRGPVSTLIGLPTRPAYISSGEDGLLVISRCTEGRLLNNISFAKGIVCAIYHEATRKIWLCLEDNTLIVRDIIFPIICYQESLSNEPLSLTLIGDNFLAIADFDRKIEIRNTETNKILSTFYGFGSEDWLIESANGYIIGKGYERFTL